ncbi:hypothetical protein V491_07000 [Pseudogymnoascus sp. VKM F-3775]|nr:hypothetical protein V491_07000 [Pseudogymnoascus sp. VKM F-3775]
MKFPVIALTCLASFAATVYSHPVANSLEQRDDDTFKSALKLALSDLGLVQKGLHVYDGEHYFEFAEPAEIARQHLSESAVKVRQSRPPFTEAGAADVKLLFKDLATASKTLLNELIVNKRTIEADSKCTYTSTYVGFIWAFSNGLVNDIVNNSGPKVKDLIGDYAGEYISNLRSAVSGFEGSKCTNKSSQ